MNLPPFNKFPTLSTEKIVLREILISDIPDIIEISFYDTKQAENVEQAMEMQERINQDYRSGNSIHWGISNRKTNKIMGTCGYYRGLETGTGELGCVLLPMYRGQGIMTNAMKLAIDFGLNKIELNHIIAITSKQNNSAIKLLDRLNFIKVDASPNDEIKFQFEAKLIE